MCLVHGPITKNLMSRLVIVIASTEDKNSHSWAQKVIMLTPDHRIKTYTARTLALDADRPSARVSFELFRLFKCRVMPDGRGKCKLQKITRRQSKIGTEANTFSIYAIMGKCTWAQIWTANKAQTDVNNPHSNSVNPLTALETNPRAVIDFAQTNKYTFLPGTQISPRNGSDAVRVPHRVRKDHCV